jgi:hypothetical protein
VILLVSDGCVQPTRVEWDKFRRYASWMRRLDFDPDPSIPEGLLRTISANSSNGILCHGLQEFNWVVRSNSLPFYRLFLSPHLTEFSMHLYPADEFSDEFSDEIPDKALSNIVSMFLELETSHLQFLHLGWHIPAKMIPGLESAVSSAILRCGPSFASLSVPVPLSDAAVQHIMRLPKLSTWAAMNGPPRVSDPSLSDAFPQLETILLEAEASLEWLPFFEACARRASSGRITHVPPNHGAGRSLATLKCWVDVSVDAAFISPILLLHGLTVLWLDSSCPSTGGCAFSLTDHDIAEIAAALPNLVDATFGYVCPANSCRTTVSSLLFLSTHCKNLAVLETHFNTTNLRDDLEVVRVDPRLRNSHLVPGCHLAVLSLSKAPISISEEDIEPVLAGFLKIFPSLSRIYGDDAGWGDLSRRLRDVGVTPGYV